MTAAGRHDLQASDLDAGVVILGGIVGAGDQGALGVGVGANGTVVHVDVGAGQVPQLGGLLGLPRKERTQT